MRERRALRFVIEAIFLGLLAAALVVADLEPLQIAGVMLLGWVVVALYEWAATRELPHYGRGLPPRYYVPQVSLPPARQLDQLHPAPRSGYPTAGPDDQATWIASPAMRAEVAADWPLDPPGTDPIATTPGEDTIVVDLPPVATGELFHENTWIELDPIAEGREPDLDGAALVAAAAVSEPDPVEPELVEPEPVKPELVEPEPVEPEGEPVVEPEPEPEPVEPEPEPVVVEELVAPEP